MAYNQSYFKYLTSSNKTKDEVSIIANAKNRKGQGIQNKSFLESVNSTICTSQVRSISVGLCIKHVGAKECSLLS
jgi:hypothetical protein